MAINEEKARQLIREELMRREEQRRSRINVHEQYKLGTEDEEKLMRIQREEERAFYKNSKDHFEYVNEVGEIEFLTRDEIRAREGYFDYEQQVENIDDEKKRVLKKLFVVIAGVFVFLFLLFLYMQPDVGQLAVVSNIQGASIVLDGQETGSVTNDILPDLSAGEHLVTLQKFGYMVKGDYVKTVQIRRNHETSILLEMIPVESSASGQK